MINNWKSIHSDFTPELQKEWMEWGFTTQAVQEWINTGFIKPIDVGYVQWLKNWVWRKPQELNHNEEKFLRKKYKKHLTWRPNSVYHQSDYVTKTLQKDSETSKEGSRGDNYSIVIQAQEYLDQHYPKNKRWVIEKLNLKNLNLEGNLDLTDFRSLQEIIITGNPKLGRLINKVLGYKGTLVKIKAQDWLDWKYPNKQEVKKIELDLQERIDGKLIISNLPYLKEIKINGNYVDKGNLTKLQINNCPQLINLDCSNNQLTELEIINCPNLEWLSCYNNRLVELDLQVFPKLKLFSCSDNLLNDLDLGQNNKLESLSVNDNNFIQQDLSFLNHLSYLKWLSLGNHNQEKIKQGIYNRFYGSLSHLKDASKLEYLSISNTDLNSGVEYLPISLDGVNSHSAVHYSAELRPQSKVNEIDWQLYLFTNRKELKKWLKIGFTLEEIKFWKEIGLNAYDHGLANYLKKEKNLDPQEIKNNLYKLRTEYNNNNTFPQEDLFLTPESLEKWIAKGFTYEQTKEWVKDYWSPRLKPSESGLAKYLQEKEITPWEAWHYVDINKLREEYNNLNKYHKKNKSISFNEEEKIEEIGNWENIDSSFRFWQIKENWVNLNFDYRQTKDWIDKGLNPYSSEFAYYLKIKGHEPSLLSTSDLIQLAREYYSVQTWLEFWYPAKKRKLITNLSIFHKKLKGDLIIESWENLEEFNCSDEDSGFSSITLNNLPKLKMLNVRDCGIKKVNINNCPQLQEINASCNRLRALDFLHNLSPKNLTYLDVSSNDISQDLSFLSKFKNLEKIALSNTRFYGTLEALKKLNKLKWLDISDTDVDSGLEYLPDNVEVIHCYERKRLREGDRFLILRKENGMCKNILKELQGYHFLLFEDSYNPQAWKENQAFFKLLEKTIKNNNIMIPNIREFLQQQGIFLNVRTGTFHGDLRSLASLFSTINKPFFEQKEKEIRFLLERIQMLTNLIKKQKEKIIQAYLCFASKNERELLQELVTNYLEFIKFKKQEIDSSDYYDKCNEYESQCKKIKDQLQIKLDKKVMNGVQRILNDCEELVEWELELEEKNNIEIELESSSKQMIIDWLQKQEQISYVEPEVRSETSSLKRKLIQLNLNDFNDEQVNNLSATKRHRQLTDSDQFSQIESLESLTNQSETSSLKRKIEKLNIQDAIEPTKRTKTENLLSQNQASERIQQIKNLLAEINNDLNLAQKQIQSLQDENQQLQTESRQLRAINNSSLLQTIEEQLSKNELACQEKTQQTEWLKEKIKQLEGQLMNLQVQGKKNQPDVQNWTNIHPNFTPQLTQPWPNHHFTYQQTQEWINIGLTPQDADFAHFLKFVKKLTPEEVLNFGNLENLRNEFINHQQTAQIIQTPLRNN